jgi:hypothetical protein
MADQFITDVTKLSDSTQGILETNAASRGMTVEEYLAERGGVNPVTKKYGDSYNPSTDLNDAEYQAAVAGKTGIDAGKALNAARDAKLKAYIAANPDSPEAREAKIAAGTQDVYGISGKGTGSSYSTGTGGGSSTSNPYEPGSPEANAWDNRKSAYDLLYSEFKTYGLESLVEPLKNLIQEGVSPSEFTLRLRETDAYKKRFAANAQRVAKGLRALSEAEYIGTEDQYQDVMRRYGLPESYYAKGDLGVQAGFEKFLGGDVSAVELEDRIQTAQNRVVNSNPEVAKALKEFYPGISNGDILAYVLDPTNAIEEIKRKVSAAEIGGAAIQSGLQTGMARAEELRNAGITKQQAQSGFGTIAGGLERGSQLASIYAESPYTQTTAEQEVFGLAGAQNASTQRKKIAGLEKATFGGQSGISSGALARDRAGAY